MPKAGRRTISVLPFPYLTVPSRSSSARLPHNRQYQHAFSSPLPHIAPSAELRTLDQSSSYRPAVLRLYRNGTMGDSASPASPTKPAVLIIGGLGMSPEVLGPRRRMLLRRSSCASLLRTRMTQETDFDRLSQDTLAVSSHTTSTATSSHPHCA